ncbi:MAG TPA: class I SAM-dependent methyltransferase [Bacteriovoracaceae bacterium]|nr:class I SAM-dependent methyltransferase [Bacteriovoracaceae bacterium]
MKGNTVASDSSPLKNRLIKNQKKLKSYLSQGKIEAYRIYNKDIPEYPYLIDIYGKHAVIYEQGKKLGDEDQGLREQHQRDIETIITEVFEIPPGSQHFKIREKQKGNDQYKSLDPKSYEYFTVSEPPMKYLVNLERYLDTGLFLDHRPLRQYLIKNASAKKVLNLFCYTSSLSVAAALGGGRVTSVDMSRTYLDWSYENFLINGIDPNQHQFIQADVLKDLLLRKENKETFDLILLDPPSFSNSKRMEEDLDIERDHPLLIRDSMVLLDTGGTLIFSTNKRKFDLHPVIGQQYQVKEISHWTIPMDFHHTDIHRAYMIQKKIV